MEQATERALYEHLSRMEKAQPVRLFDVFILAPALVYVSNTEKLSPNMSNFLLLVGLGTAVFNGYNYVQIEQLKKSLER